MAAEGSNTALLTEHLSYPPVALLDDIVNSVNLIGFKAVDAVEAGLLGAPPTDLGFKPLKFDAATETESQLEVRAKDEIENGVHQFETLLSASIDKNFDKMEIYVLRSLIAIPEELRDWIRLRGYQNLNFLLPADAPTTESILHQRQKQRESLRLNRILLAEKDRYKSILAQLQRLTSSPPKREPTQQDGLSEEQYPTFAFLSQKSDLQNTSSSAPLSTTTQFALSQLPALKALLGQLRVSMQTLSQDGAAMPKRDVNFTDVDRTFREQRGAYVESETRRQLELRGVELDGQGKVRDGEWQSEGRKLGKGEVEALERVIDLVRGAECETS